MTGPRTPVDPNRHVTAAFRRSGIRSLQSRELTLVADYVLVVPLNVARFGEPSPKTPHVHLIWSCVEDFRGLEGVLPSG